MRPLLLLLLAACCATLAYTQAGTPDPNFGNEGIVKANLFIGRGPGTARKTFVQPDSTLMVVVQEDNQVALAHFFSDGRFDREYGYFNFSYTLSMVYGDAVQDSMGRFVIAGTHDRDMVLARIDAGGSVYLNIALGFPDSAVATAVAIQPDGKIVMAGYAYSGGIANFAVARILPDGTPDSTFSGDGKLTTSNGNHGAFATCLALQADGKIVVGGYAGGYGARSDFALVRYNANGSRDLTFSGDGKQLTTVGVYDDRANAIAIQRDGRILLAGRTQHTNSASGEYDIATVRYNANGSLDATFSGDGIAITPIGTSAQAASILVQKNAKIVIAATAGDFVLLRYNSDGSLDASLGNGGVRATDFNNGQDRVSSAQLTGGKILVTGWTDPAGGEMREIALARYTADNVQPDGNFSGDGKVAEYFSTSSTRLHCTTIQPDGKLLVAGSGSDNDYAEFTMLVMARYNPDGSFDTSFGVKGKVNSELEGFGAGASAIAMQSNGKIIIGSGIYNFDNNSSDFILVRYTSTGIIDSTFGTNGVTYIDFRDEPGSDGEEDLTAIAIYPNGKIVAVGMAEGIDVNRMAIARCNADGSLDASFSGNGKQVVSVMEVPYEIANAVAIQPDGKIVVAGTTISQVIDHTVFAVVRLNTDGSLDQSFSRDGKLTTAFGPTSNSGAASVAIQPDKKIVVGGSSNGNFALVRYFPNGNLDLGFSGDGKQTTNFGGNNDAISEIVLRPNGNILAAGTSQGHFAMAQYFEDGILQMTAIMRNENDLGGIAVFGDRLYMAGSAYDYQSIGIIAALYLEDNTIITKALTKTGHIVARSELVATAFPNPAVQYFTLQTKSKSEALLNVRITDAAGRIMEIMRNRPANGYLQFGANYSPGIYYAELQQGTEIKTIKLVKRR